MKELGDDDIRAQVSKLEEDYIVYLGHYKLTIGGEDASFFRDSILARACATAPRPGLKSGYETPRPSFATSLIGNGNKNGMGISTS